MRGYGGKPVRADDTSVEFLSPEVAEILLTRDVYTMIDVGGWVGIEFAELLFLYGALGVP